MRCAAFDHPGIDFSCCADLGRRVILDWLVSNEAVPVTSRKPQPPTRPPGPSAPQLWHRSRSRCRGIALCGCDTSSSIWGGLLAGRCWIRSRRFLSGKRGVEAVQGLWFQGMRASISALDHWLAMRPRVWVSHAAGSTLFILLVCRRVAMMAHVRPSPSDPAKRMFLWMMVCGLIARSTMLESGSMRLSVRKRSKISRLAIA